MNILYFFFGKEYVFCNDNGWFYIQFCDYILKYPSSKQNVVLLLPSMKLSCHRQGYLLVVGNLLVRKQYKNFIVPNLHASLYFAWTCPLFSTTTAGTRPTSHFPILMVGTFTTTLSPTLKSSTFILLRFACLSIIFSPLTFMFFWIYYFALESVAGEEYWILKGFPFQGLNLKH